MKKKFLIALPMLVVAMIFLIKTPVYATKYDKHDVEYSLPDEFESSATYEVENEFYTLYDAEVGDECEYKSVSVDIKHVETGLLPLTQSDMENRKQNIINSYIGSEQYIVMNGDIEGKMIEIDGVPGYQITYSITKNTGEVYSECVIYANADKTSLNVRIEGPDANYVFSNEVKSIIKSFKIKDTIINAKGIPFHDVAKSAWYYGAVKYMYENNIISGLDKYTFGPYEKLTRGMIVTILWRMENSPANDGKSKFTDVASDKWYSQAIKWAAANKIVNGYSGTTKFGPNDNILRQDLAGILRNYAKYKGKDINVTADLTKFKDYKQISSYAKPSMEWAVGKGVISGNGDGTLAPKGNATRAEAAAMIQKYCNKVGK